MKNISRRNLLIGAAAVGGSIAVARTTELGFASNTGKTVPFLGAHQSGIETGQQSHVTLIAFDVTTASKSELIDLMKSWTSLSNDLTQETSTIANEDYNQPPADNGEGVDLEIGELTITSGFGPTLFENSEGLDRFGISKFKPVDLAELPKMPGDQINPETSFGDICIQICGNNQQMVFRAAHQISRAAFGSAKLRWSTNGYMSLPKDGVTPRNLFGFKDGTKNPRTVIELDEHVWVSNQTEPAWLIGGSYMAFRNIQMHITTWDRSILREQEQVFGRTKREGAPLSGGDEFSEPDFGLSDRNSVPVIPVDSHVAIAHSSNFGDRMILRRPYNYHNGINQAGNLEIGQLFISFQRSISETLKPMLIALSKSDRLMEYITHISTGIYAIPRGVTTTDDYVGKQLLEA